MLIVIQLKLILLAVLVGTLLSGCINKRPDYYYWGSYEQLLLDMYNKPGAADAALQIQQLTEDIQKAESLGKPLPPGIYAHLGFMYAIQGQVTQSQAAFNEEKARYPESKSFIDGMQKRAMQKRKVTNAPS